jgi:hypothetical protein
MSAAILSKYSYKYSAIYNNQGYVFHEVQMIFPQSLMHYPHTFSKLNVRIVQCLIGYNRPTLCNDYYSFIYYSGSYMFRHLCAILRERPLSL